MIHVDDFYIGKRKNKKSLRTLCGLAQLKIWPKDYGLLEKQDLNKKVKLCKKCLKISYKNGYDLVTTVIKMKLTKEVNNERQNY